MHTHETVVARVAVNSKLTCTDAQVFIDYVRNRLNSSDDTMESFDGAFHAIIRTQRDVSSLILAAIQEEPEGKTGRSESTQLRHYDGLRSKYNLWDKAVRRNFATVGLLSLDKVRRRTVVVSW